MKLRVELSYDKQSQSWAYRVPSLRILGGGVDTRDQAESEALQAIEFALEPVNDESDDDVDEVAYFDVQVTPAKVTTPAA